MLARWQISPHDSYLFNVNDSINGDLSASRPNKIEWTYVNDKCKKEITVTEASKLSVLMPLRRNAKDTTFSNSMQMLK